MRWLRNWSVHNLVAHPVSEILFLLDPDAGQKIGNWLHDRTLPDHEYGKGRG